MGNFDWVFEENWLKAYRPMLEALGRHPGVKATLHYSGPLIDWLTAHRPEFEELLDPLVARGQVEIAGGGYYEPILSMLPAADRVGQLRHMRDEIERRWGTAPAGAWLTERVWEPGIAAALAEGGAAYTLVDDSHFESSGLTEDQLDGHYLTEEEGKVVAVFPGLRTMRQHIPWKPVEEVVEWFRERASTSPRLFVMGDDGEKFGAWPETYEYCWGAAGGWVEGFFTALDENSNWLRTTQLREWLESQPRKGPVYLPTGSYQEMEEWSLPPEAQERRKQYREAAGEAGLPEMSLRPGFWRNYLVRYPEVAAMRHRIFRTRRLLDRVDQQLPGYAAAQDLLWQGECNCPYWHGIFGGVYLHPLRVRTTALLSAAESRAEELAGETGSRTEDTDMDLAPEILLRNPYQRLIIDPVEGGALVEWDSIDPPWPLLGVLARRPEAYHRDLGQAGSESISPHAEGELVTAGHDLVFDAGRRAGLQERWLKRGASARAWRRRSAELDLPLSREWDCSREKSDSAVCRDTRGPFGVKRRVRLRGKSLEIGYEVDNVGKRTAAGTLVSEWNLTLPDEWGGPGREMVDAGHRDLTVSAGGCLDLRARWEGFAEVWTMPVETVSSSERGLELTYQGLCLGFAARLSLRAGERVKLKLLLEVRSS